MRRNKSAPAPPAGLGLRLTFPRRGQHYWADVWPLREQSTPSHEAPTTRITWSIALSFAIAYATVFACLSPLALQDFPNHLARAQVLADLLFEHGARFGNRFDLHVVAVPYLLGDLVLATAVEFLGITGAALLWSILSFLSLPGALLFYLGTTRISVSSRALLVLVSLYLATDWFFLVGFLEFRLGVALTLVILGLAERFRARPTATRLLLYAVVLSAGYLTHLTTLVFACVLSASTALLRLIRAQTRLSVEAALLAPCLALTLWHFGFTGTYRQPEDIVENPYFWGTVAAKFGGVMWPFERYSARPDLLMMLALGTTIACQVGNPWSRNPRHCAVDLEFLVLAGIMLVLYIILPVGYSEAYYVDVRALPLATLFLLLGLLSATPANGDPAGRPGLALLLGVALVGGNLIYLAMHMHHQKQWLAQYRNVIAGSTPGSWILPVYTHAPEGNVVPFLHAFAFASIDRDAVVPYLQTGDTGNPQKYLRYHSRPYAPSQLWYGDLPPDPVDWHRVACEYQYLLVTQPFDPTRLLLQTSIVTENDSASLLSIQKPPTCANTPVEASPVYRFSQARSGVASSLAKPDSPNVAIDAAE